jgi:putative phage-type endonuclease
MSQLSKNNEQSIRKLLKDKYSQKYDKSDFNQIINEISKDINFYDLDILLDFVLQYSHLNKDDILTFNIKRKNNVKFPNNVLEKFINNIPEELSNNIPEELVNNAPEELVNNAPEELVNNAPEELVNNAPEELVNNAPEELVNNAPEELANNVGQTIQSNIVTIDEKFDLQVTDHNNNTIEIKNEENIEKIVSHLVNDIQLVHDQINFIEGSKENNDDNNDDSADSIPEGTEEEIKYENTTLYKFPTEENWHIIKKDDPLYEPFGTQWIREIQVHDVIDEIIKKRQKTLAKLMNIKYPAQKSDEWHALRHGKITASDAGTILGMNHHEAKYKFLIKKLFTRPFMSNKFCYHGNKFEQIATMIYEYRMNVSVVEFGLVAHETINYLAASPDGIVSKYKLDGKTLTKHVGRMLEIKCPPNRNINMEGIEVNLDNHAEDDGICPRYYWAQVQLQLECCDLDECDFWQCKITEYKSRDKFIQDTDTSEPFRSKDIGFEKGCLIQLVPAKEYAETRDEKFTFNKFGEYSEYNKYAKMVYEHARYIHPPKIEMSPYDCDQWVSKTLANLSSIIQENSEFKEKNYVLDRVVYWRLEKSKCITIERDTKWFEEKLPFLKRMWSYIEFFRKHDKQRDLLENYIDCFNTETRSEKQQEEMNRQIMSAASKLYKIPKKDAPDSDKKEYQKYLISLKKEIDDRMSEKDNKTKGSKGGYKGGGSSEYLF